MDEGKPSMTRQPVQSSNLKSVGYDPATKKMQVEFSGSGQVYEYDGIEPHEHQQLVGAASVGSHFSQHIRGRKGITFRKVSQ